MTVKSDRAQVTSPKIVSYVMSGGVGSRLWPLSREDFPKQFHDFSGGGSMLSRTLARLQARKKGQTPIYVIAAEAHENRLRQEIADHMLQGGRPIFEPLGRNTAAAVALATQLTLQEHGDALVLMVPSDHEITTDEDFWATIEQGVAAARRGKIVTFGVQPDRAETGYGYIETGAQRGDIFEVLRFVEKPDQATAAHYLESGRFWWNCGIFLFSAAVMQQNFAQHAPHIWEATAAALAEATSDIAATWLPFALYQKIPADSVDYAIMERTENIALVPAHFRWNDLGSWQSLLDVGAAQDSRDGRGNVIVGDVVAIDCEGSYLRSEGGLLSAVGVRNMAVVKTVDATFVAPVDQSQNVRAVVTALEKSGRLEAKFTPAPDRLAVLGSLLPRVRHWLFEAALPLWSTCGVDEKGGFYETLNFNGQPLPHLRRMRTMARQIYAFAVAGQMGWEGPATALVAHGIDFIVKRGRSPRGGWIAAFDGTGNACDVTEDLYDNAFVLLALAHAHQNGHAQALSLAAETCAFLDTYLADAAQGGFLETVQGGRPWRRSNPHMHMLESFLALYDASGDVGFLHRAERIVALFQEKFFNATDWTVGEYFTHNWQRAPGAAGDLCEPGHHFEWAALLIAYVRRARAENLLAAHEFDAETDRHPLIALAHKLYAWALANGINRATGLAYNSVARHGAPINAHARSWPQTEVLKAAIALDGTGGPNLKPEIEARLVRLLRWHIEPAPRGLWIDQIDESGRGGARDVPASIFYHLITALKHYIDFVEKIS